MCITNSISECQNDWMEQGAQLYACFPGLRECLTKELKSRQSHVFVEVIAPSGCKHLSWKGGSIFVSLSTLVSIRVTQEEHEDWK
jgi:actin-related protein